jgi:hypothetical protein
VSLINKIYKPRIISPILSDSMKTPIQNLRI